MIGINSLNEESVLGVAENNMPVLVGAGTDGASVNISDHNGLMGLMQQSVP